MLAGRLQMADRFLIWMLLSLRLLIYSVCWLEVGLPLPRFLCLVVRVGQNSLGLRVGSGEATGAGTVHSRLAFGCPDLKAIDATGHDDGIADADLRVVE